MSLREELLHALATLDLEPGCDPSAVKTAYVELAQIWHPDRFLDKPNLQRRATEKLQQINQAYELLREHYTENPYLAQDYTQPYRSARSSPPGATTGPASHSAPYSSTPDPDTPDPWARAWRSARSTAHWERSMRYRRWSRALGGMVLGVYLLLGLIPAVVWGLIGAGLVVGVGSWLVWSFRGGGQRRWQQVWSARSSSPQADRASQGSRRSGQAHYEQLQARLVELAGSDAVARVLFKCLIDRYPGKGAEWYYQQAIEILEYQRMET